MSAGSQRPPSGSNSRAAETRVGRSLATYPTPSSRESMIAHDTVSRYHATQPESRNDSAHDGYIHSNGSSRRHSTDSHTPQQQAVVSASRRYHISPPQQLEPTNPQSSQQNSHQRPPNLSLDTRNLSNPRPSPFTPSRPAENSPPADSSSMLYSDLASLKSGLESLWTHSSNKLHTLHHTISTQSETLRSLSITNATLESMAQQHAALSQEVERLGGENNRLIKEVREAEEARAKALREREMLGEANARLWEDKARLEGEKRELRVKLDAEVDFARLCQRELEKGDDSRTTRSGVVKVEENDEERMDDGIAEIRVPLVHVEEIIKKRLQRQADDFTRAADEVYGKLALSQTRVTELEGQIKRYSANANTGGSAPSVSSHPPPPCYPNSRKAEDKSEKAPPDFSPVTPHTALPSSVSENDRDYPFAKAWNGQHAPEQASHPRLSSASTKQGESRLAPPVASREVRVPHRTVSGHVESKSPDKDKSPDKEMRPRRVSAAGNSTSMSSRSVSYSNSPVMEPIGRGKPVAPGHLADAAAQVASTYAGLGSVREPAALPSARTSHPQRSLSHSRPTTPDRPVKRARTAEPPDGAEAPKTDEDVNMTIETAQSPSISPQAMQHPEDVQPGREMTADERRMFTSLSRVLVKKRDNDGWKCVLCRQEKKSPTATFSETTPIGVVTRHVRETHVRFWKDLNGAAEQAVAPG